MLHIHVDNACPSLVSILHVRVHAACPGTFTTSTRTRGGMGSNTPNMDMDSDMNIDTAKDTDEDGTVAELYVPRHHSYRFRAIAYLTANDAGTGLSWRIRYPTEMMDARMLMLSLVSSIPMPSYDPSCNTNVQCIKLSKGTVSRDIDGYFRVYTI